MVHARAHNIRTALRMRTRATPLISPVAVYTTHFLSAASAESPSSFSFAMAYPGYPPPGGPGYGAPPSGAVSVIYVEYY